ncbi:MAG: lipid-binding SYLF domain-containing protein [Vicinamibacterales bacterium]
MPDLGKLIRSLAAGAAVVALAAPAQAADNQKELERVTKSIEVLTQLSKTPDQAIPGHILERAEAIVVIPTLVKGGFVIGAEHGKGIMSVRDRATGTWSVPSFVAMTGGSIGWQIGVQSVDLVLLVMNRDGVEDLLSSEFKLGADASVAAGPVGRAAQAATDAKMGAKILAYSRAQGLFAGVSVQGLAA